MASTIRLLASFLAAGTLTACIGVDPDFRSIGNGFDTSEAVQGGETGARPAPDSRGLISYPGYQVAIARRGDTVSDVAARVGVPAVELARFNGLQDGVPLRSGETLVLPEGSQPQPAPGGVDVAAIAGSAIERAGGSVATGPEPGRHRVQPGETAFSISRQYGVSPNALAEWNGLDADFNVRPGQVLLIPSVASPANATGTQIVETQTGTAPVATAAIASGTSGAPARRRPEGAQTVARTTTEQTSAPGQGTRAPEPPSASQPLPAEDTRSAAAAPAPATPKPDLSADKADTARLLMPVSGSIARAYKKGSNDGIGISAAAGTSVKAADAGTVAAITRDTDQVPILVLRHEGNLLTVYAGVEDVAVEKGDRVRRGETIAKVRSSGQPFLHFEVREGFESVDPMPYLN